ncbi:hypothetical protein K9U33_10525 [Rhodoblastus acidophilus]|uniref:Uncharacterized protein n=1 Tax=Candidatus Rhodoblastus alkanivorans TaxID=2954117 RepID=A0ABS9ZAZ7_9HYPH|nr:hypothetical protein [Candidatus Rhodoblastus alkanivorans]MCI4679080.1 hypothetical protein [Candidatus Rhodoblastus alkanivorans]MCI4684898.1 hypothetical protein [Candidatus Rhodoblastus alkanivorans]
MISSFAGPFEVVGDIAADITPEERAESVKMCRNLLYHAMKQLKHRRTLRTLHIGGSLHSGMRWDKERKFKPNDYYDFHHATAALSYCDYFLTDGPLHVLITRPQLDLERVNDCKVLSDPAEAAEAMRFATRPTKAVLS